MNLVNTPKIVGGLKKSFKIYSFVNISRTNDVRFINNFFEAVNFKFNSGDIFIGCLERSY